MSSPQPLKLPIRLKLEFDQLILKRFREWEKIERKIAAFRNHLHFTLHCKHHGLFPPSLSLKCSMKGPGTDKILLKAQKALMNERITRIKKQLAYYEGLRSDMDEFLFTKLPNACYQEVCQWMAHARRARFVDIRERQKTKFERLQMKSKRCDHKDKTIVEVDDRKKEEVQNKWVVNLSKRQLSTEETNLLKKGMNFAITPQMFPVDDYIIGTESACKLIGQDSKQAERIRSDVVKIIKHNNTPRSNITPGERKALHELAKDKDITILPADKGRAVVILNTSDYKSKAKILLDDTKTYKVLKKDPTTKYTNTLVSKLQELKNAGTLDEIAYKRLYPTSAVIPKFYGLPKVHKAGAPLRPIVASRGSITYDVARFVADILAPIVGKNGYALKNSADLVKQLSNCQLDEDDVLVSFDVTALFTCVPVDKSLDIILQKLSNDTSLSDRTTLSAK